MRSLLTILAGAGLMAGVAQAAMPPVLRAMGQTVTWRPFEIAVTGADVARGPASVRLTLSYRVKNVADGPAPPPLLTVWDPEGHGYRAEAIAEAAVAAGAQADLKAAFGLPARFDPALWQVGVGGANGPRIALGPAGPAR